MGMSVPAIRKLLSHEELKKVTEKALATGPFEIKKVTRVGSQVQVLVKFSDGHRKEFTLD